MNLRAARSPSTHREGDPPYGYMIPKPRRVPAVYLAHAFLAFPTTAALCRMNKLCGGSVLNIPTPPASTNFDDLDFAPAREVDYRISDSCKFVTPLIRGAGVQCRPARIRISIKLSS